MFHDTPMDTVQPSSSFTRWLISRATSSALRLDSASAPVRSSHASSRPNGSTRSVYW